MEIESRFLELTYDFKTVDELLSSKLKRYVPSDFFSEYKGKVDGKDSKFALD